MNSAPKTAVNTVLLATNARYLNNYSEPHPLMVIASDHLSHNQAGQDVRTPCPAGHFQNVTGQSFCHECLAGTYQDSVGQQACVPCPENHYCEYGATDFTPCPNEGDITDKEGAKERSECKDCANPNYYRQNATSCVLKTRCSEDQYEKSPGMRCFTNCLGTLDVLNSHDTAKNR